MHHGPQYHPNDVRRTENRSRREVQRRFTPGTLGVTVPGDKVFTVVGWSPVAAVKAQAGDKERPFRLARPASWEVLVLVADRLETWNWERLKSHKTLEEWNELDAVP